MGRVEKDQEKLGKDDAPVGNRNASADWRRMERWGWHPKLCPCWYWLRR